MRELLKKEDVNGSMFAPGAFVMLHPNVYPADMTRHPDAGRIGKVSSEANGKLVVQLFDDDLVGKMTACILPKELWLPVPAMAVEEYFPRAKKRGWRLSERGSKLFSDLKWIKNEATEGKIR